MSAAAVIEQLSRLATAKKLNKQQRAAVAEAAAVLAESARSQVEYEAYIELQAAAEEAWHVAAELNSTPELIERWRA